MAWWKSAKDKETISISLEQGIVVFIDSMEIKMNQKKYTETEKYTALN